MVAKHLHNTSTADQLVQAQILYKWLTFVNQFPVIDTNGSNWTPVSFSGSTGVVNPSTPTSFYDANPVFSPTHVGQHIAIRDSLNPTNCFIAEITAYVSPTRITLDASAILSAASTDVEYIIFDTGSPPSTGDYFVIQNPLSTGPQWQARCIVGAAPAALEWELGFIGGWDIGGASWTLPVSASHFLPASVARTFCVADSALGYFFLWAEDPPGGSAADRNALWVGSLLPFHSPIEFGVPKDLSYSAIFGSRTSPAPTSNLSRATTSVDNFVVGQVLSESSTVISAYVAQMRLLSSATDVLTQAAAVFNPRSSEVDVYDAVVFTRTPNQGWRGKLPGVFILNDNVVNRTPINSNLSYVLGNGIGAVWNGKTPQP